MANKIQRKQSLRFGSGILADSAATTDSGKINAIGIFTLFWAWDFPCQRRGVAIISLFDFHKGKTKLSISIKKKGSKAKKVTTIEVEAKKDIPPMVQSIGLNLPLNSSGSYELVFSIPRTSRMLRIPFEVEKKSWPQFTKAEIDFVKANPNTVNSIRANIHCSKCSHVYVFEETLLDTPPDGGVQRFSESGNFKCVKCNHVLKLRDFQGQLRTSLKKQIKQAMGKKQ